MADVISMTRQHEEQEEEKEEELSDEQMQQILAQAAQRRKDEHKDQTKSSTTASLHFPKLNTGNMTQPYVSNQGEVARVDATRLLAANDRKLANRIRKVDDPVAVKNKLLEVCFISFSSSSSSPLSILRP
jgi:ribosomal protein S18